MIYCNHASVVAHTFKVQIFGKLVKVASENKLTSKYEQHSIWPCTFTHIHVLKFVHPPKGMWRVFWGHRGQTQGGICSRLMWSHVHVSSGLKYVWCTISLLTKTRRQNTEIPWRPVLDFLVKPGAKINQLWGKNRLALIYGKGWVFITCINSVCVQIRHAIRGAHAR